MQNSDTKIDAWPGPMEGLMSPEFIRAAGGLGVTQRWMTPFFRVSTACPRLRYFRDFLAPWLESGVPVTVQIMGTDAEVLAESALRFMELGAAGINFNCGCPSRQVTSGGAGGGALRDPRKTATLLQAIRAKISGAPFSVKLRMGWESPLEAEGLIPLFCDTGIDFLIVHFRTVREQYQPVPGRAERLARAQQLAGSTPLVINGDYFDAASAREEATGFDAAGVMCARGFLRDPGLLERIEGRPVEPPETMRRKLFGAALEQTLKVSRAIELSNFLWGSANPFFPILKTLIPSQKLDREFLNSFDDREITPVDPQ